MCMDESRSKRRETEGDWLTGVIRVGGEGESARGREEVAVPLKYVV